MPINNAINAPFIVTGFGCRYRLPMLSGVALAAGQMSKENQTPFYSSSHIAVPKPH